METLAYLHLSCANESFEEDYSNRRLYLSKLCNRSKQQQRSSPVHLKFLGLITGLAILSVASSALAQADFQQGDFGQGANTTDGYYSPNSGVLQRGDSGPAVSDLQSRLASLGYYSGSIDGVFGPDTESAVIRFQRDRGLVEDGIAGPQVLQALDSPGTTPPDNGYPPSYPSGLSPGDEGAAVENLQRRLQRLGYFNTSVTGYYGSVTRDAVAAFQRDQGLPATGIADQQTLSALDIGGTDRPTRRYAVIVPTPDAAALAQVRRVIPDAVPLKDRRGDFVRVETFSTPEAAQRRTDRLRARGLTNARVVFE